MNNGCDFTIKVEGKEILAHKQILAAWSPVMKKMFSSGMKDSIESELVETNFAYETMEALVDYMYFGAEGEIKKLYENNANTMDLLKAAHFYQMPLLMKAGEYSLVNKLTSENAIDCFRVAKLLNADILRKVIFIIYLYLFVLIITPNSTGSSK